MSRTMGQVISNEEAHGSPKIMQMFITDSNLLRYNRNQVRVSAVGAARAWPTNEY